MIMPLLDENINEGKRSQLRDEIAEKYGLSKRSIYRYEAKYRENAFEGLKPQNREKRRNQALPENYDEIVGEAIQLKREVSRRSVRQIIKILEIEGYAAPGVIKASTLTDRMEGLDECFKTSKEQVMVKNTITCRKCMQKVPSL